MAFVDDERSDGADESLGVGVGSWIPWGIFTTWMPVAEEAASNEVVN
ncbi:hypothetical protein [Saccharothrix carnea]|nr:hypothetical protein [Saccharothrix carnea]